MNNKHREHKKLPEPAKKINFETNFSKTKIILLKCLLKTNKESRATTTKSHVPITEHKNKEFSAKYRGKQKNIPFNNFDVTNKL